MHSRVVAVADIARLIDPATIEFTEHERARRELLVDPADRAAFDAAHALVRLCAAELLDVDVHAVVLDQQCPTCGAAGHGRPSVRIRSGTDDHLAFDPVFVSLSHTRSHVAASAASTPCGIDVEIRAASIPQRALTPREHDWVAAQPDAELAFTRLWVRKEAIVKAGGGELAAAATIDVLGHDDEPANRYEQFDLAELPSTRTADGQPIVTCTARARA